MRPRLRDCWWLLSLAVVLPASLTFAAGAAATRPQLVVTRAPAGTQVAVDYGDAGRHLLRVAAGQVAPGPSGADPTGSAAFATWDEADGRRWFSYTRDAGASWSEARPLARELRLRDGATAPGGAMPRAPQGFELGAGRLFLVQFRTIGLPEWRAALAALGAEVL
ncbi:MAG: exo-alpha-sialidase, partial [Acidobacteria bacterium]|nr:exo-alpha-sialidase [Acidobacteriota bacterium]